MSMPRAFRVSGMTCGACSARVERTLSQLPALRRAHVNLATQRATVIGDATDAAIIEAIQDAGYDAERIDATAPPGAAAARREAEETAHRAALRRRLLVAAMFAAPLFVLAMLELHFPGVAFVQWALATPVVFYSGSEFFRVALRLARHGGANMDTLIAIGVAAAYALSVFLALSPGDHPHLYFEVASTVVALVLVGKNLEARARSRALDALRSLADLRPAFATLRRNQEEIQIPAGEVLVDDLLVVRPGQRIPTDAVVVEGASEVDESMLTGESVPVLRQPGDRVTGGTLNTHGAMVVRATAIGADTALSRIVRLVEDAQDARAPVQRLADAVSAKFVPVVLAIAAVTLVGWLASGASLRDALLPTVSVLVIACPCALGLATPTALMVGTGRAAELGILIRDASVLESARSINLLAFDKTGTLTEGAPRVTDRVDAPTSPDAESAWRWVAAAERASEHPAGRAIATFFASDLPSPSAFTAVPGQGIEARFENGPVVRAGRAPFLHEHGVATNALDAIAASLQIEGKTSVYAAVDGALVGVLGLSDTIKPAATSAVDRLNQRHLRLAVLTGDHRTTAERVASTVGIDTVIAEATPAEKLRWIERWQADGLRVAMVGDGINDAPALGRADLGIAMATGSDVAIGTATMTLLHGDLSKVATALDLADATFRIVRQNLVWAFAFNTVGIPLAAFGGLSPMVASAAMAMSSVSVVTNALRLRRFTPQSADLPNQVSPGRDR